jgi:hypothetical protein
MRLKLFQKVISGCGRRCKQNLGSSGMLRNIDWWLVSDVSGQAVCVILKRKGVQEDP